MQEGSGPCKFPNLSHLLWSYGTYVVCGTCMHGPPTKLKNSYTRATTRLCNIYLPRAGDGYVQQTLIGHGKTRIENKILNQMFTG